MFGHNFYHALTRKYIVLFGTMFNDISITRRNAALTDSQTIKVPLTYASHDKMMARLFGDPELNKQPAAVTPAMSFVDDAPFYDAERKLQTSLKRCFSDGDGIIHQYVGVPYIFPFTLYIYSREKEDGLRILEQILPFFTPSFTVTAELIPEMGYSPDIPIILDSINLEDDSYGEVANRRRLIWTLQFKLKGELLGPVDDNKKIIRTVHANIRDIDSLQIMEEVHIEPGLTVNGEPTSDRTESIPIEDINADDNYGYVVDINEGPVPHP